MLELLALLTTYYSCSILSVSAPRGPVAASAAVANRAGDVTAAAPFEPLRGAADEDCNDNGQPDDQDIEGQQGPFYSDLVPLGPRDSGLDHGLADDLHFSNAGLMTSFDVGYYNGTTVDVLMDVTFWTNNAENDPQRDFEILAYYDLVVPPTKEAVHHHELAQAQPLPPHVWMEVSFSTTSAGLLISTSEPTAGWSADLYYDPAQGRTRNYGGAYAANFVLAVSGTVEPVSADCNGNGVPDECDLADSASSDCNANGTPDECDVADGTSRDCNADGVPDECAPSGDFDSDGDVDLNDFALFAVCYGSAAVDECACADANGDGAVDMDDFAALVAGFGG